MDTIITADSHMERLDNKVDVECFLEHDLTAEIVKGEYAKVCDFLHQLRRKLIQHQQVSRCSKRIFKPASRSRRIWMANHLKAMREMQLVYQPRPEPEPPLKPSKRLW